MFSWRTGWARITNTILLVVLIASSTAQAAELIISDGLGWHIVGDNQSGDANPALGVIDLPSHTTSGGMVITDLRCEISIGVYSALARILPATGAYATITNPTAGSAAVVIDCQDSLDFEIYGPGAKQWLWSVLADDPTPDTLDIIEAEFSEWRLSSPVSVPPAGPCPSTGSPQPCLLQAGAVADYFQPVYMTNDVRGQLAIEIGAGDRVRLTALEYLVVGSEPPNIPALTGWGMATLSASILAAARFALPR
jgi:hypothetical protein